LLTRRLDIESSSRIKRNETMNKASAGNPERKISETILDFGEPPSRTRSPERRRRRHASALL
jgi:hypothetical protein